MRGFPPPAAAQVTLANWRLPPFNRWAFRNVREIVPSALISRSRGRHWRFPRRIAPVERIEFEWPAGEGWSISRMLDASLTDGFIVLKHGTIVHESYYGRNDAESPHIVFSVSKSVTALLAGILAGRGLLDPTAPVVRYIPEAKSSAYGDATVRHVLDMTVGIAFEENYLDPKSDFVRYREATAWNPAPPDGPDLRSFLITLKPDGKPHGFAFHYVSPNSDLLGWILERASGERFSALASRLLWRPMGAESHAYVTVDRHTAPRSAGGICMTLRDMARVGELVRCRGMARGKQVVPGEWIDDMLQNGDSAAWKRGNPVLMPEGRYRSKWYLTREGGALCAIGIHGQWIYVDMAAGVTIAKQSSQALPVEEPTDHLLLAGFAAVAKTV